jgi:hypothetical protein
LVSESDPVLSWRNWHGDIASWKRFCADQKTVFAIDPKLVRGRVVVNQQHSKIDAELDAPRFVVTRNVFR